jgi:cupin 2 domain-containing protein
MNPAPKQNILETLKTPATAERFETLLQRPHLRVERIISWGHKSDPGFWYDQAEAEWVLVLKGAARLEFEDHSVDLVAGDYLNIEPHQKHRVDWTTPEQETIWLAIFH